MTGLPRFLLLRLLHLVPVVLGVTFLVFTMLKLVPGDPATAILGIRATPEAIAAIREALGLDRPFLVQYLAFLGHLLRGNLGESLVAKQPVLPMILERMPATLSLVAMSALFGAVLTVPPAVLAARHKDRPLDHLVRGTFIFGLAIPGFWLGIILMLVFSLKLRLFPVSGFGATWVERLHHLVLPSFTVALALAAILIRNLRAGVLEVLRADYVRTARAKGLTERAVMRRHVMRNALLSTVTVFGVNLAFLIGGTVVVETVFSLPGLGAMLVTAVYQRDYPVVQGITLVFAVLIILVNLLVDLAYVALDPRVTFD
ncbi:MAG: ABC transporter permease [Armatimonadota bacterium]|nr:ABC transporter permease [Armatimonadota bacterium]